MKKETVTSVLKRVGDVLHRINVKLYPNYLPKGGGPYIARTDNERVLSMEDVCTALENRGGFAGDKGLLLKHVQKYYDEVVYQLCDGYAVNSGYYTLYPNIGGTFFSPKEVRDHKKHPLGFRFREGAVLKQLAKLVEVNVDGFADTNGFIYQLTDVDTDTTNNSLTEGGDFVINGDKIKITEDDAECGVYFELTDEPGTRVKVEKRLSRNTPSQLIGRVPMLITPKSYRVVIVTRYAGSSTILKEPRTIVSAFELDAE